MRIINDKRRVKTCAYARTFAFEGSVRLGDVTETGFAIGSDGPRLDVTQKFVLHVPIQGLHLEHGTEVIHELSRRNFSEKVVSAVLDTYICQLTTETRKHKKRMDMIKLHTPNARSCTFGFLWFSRFLRARIASLGGKLFERIWSHISRLRAISSVPVGISSEVAFSGSNCKLDVQRGERV